MAENIRVVIEGSSRDLQVAVAEAVASLKVLERETRQANRSAGLNQLGNAAGAAEVQIGGLAQGLRNFQTVGLAGLLSLTSPGAAGIASLGAGGGEAVAGLAPLTGLLATLPAVLAGGVGALGTLQLGLDNVGAALKGNQAAYNELTPAAKGFVVELHNMLPEVRQLQATAQAKLFPGFLAALHELHPLIGPANQIVGQFAGTLSHLAKQSVDFLVNPRHLRELTALFSQGDQLVGRFGRATFNWGDAILQIATAARPLTGAISKDIVGISRDFDSLVTKARRSGDLQSFFKATLDVTETLFTTLGNLGGAFINIGKVAFPFGDRMLHGLEDITGKFQEWTRSASGKNGIAEFFKDAQPPLRELGLLVVELSKGIGVLVNLGFTPLTQIAHDLRVDLVPLLVDIGRLLSEILPDAIALIDSLIKFAHSLAPEVSLLIGPLKGLLEVLKALTDTLTTLNNVSPVLGVPAIFATIAAGALAIKALESAWKDVKAAATGAKVAEEAAANVPTIAPTIAPGAARGAAAGAGGAVTGTRAGRVAASLGTGEAAAGTAVGAGFLAKIKGLGPRLRVLGKAALWTDIALGVLDGVQQKGGITDKIDEAIHSFTLGLLPGPGNRNSPDLIKRLNALKGQPGTVQGIKDVAGSLNPFGGNFGHPGETQDAARKLLGILKQIPGADEQHLRGLKAQAVELAKQLQLTGRQKAHIAGLLGDQQRAQLQLRGHFTGFGLANAIAKDHQLTKAELRKMKATLDTLPPAARQTASDTIVEMTKRLIAQGDLPVSAFKRIMRALKQEADHGGVKLNTSLASSFASMLGLVSQSSTGLFRPLNAALKALGVKPIKITAQSLATSALGIGAGLVSGLGTKKKARGGFLDGTPDLRDKTPVLAARDEAFLTRHQQRPIQAALARDKARGDGAYGSLQEVFGRVTTPHYMAQGGYPGSPNALAHSGTKYQGPFGSGAGFVPVTNLARDRFQLRPTAGRTNHSPNTAQGRPSDHAWGGAVDYSNGVLTPQEDAFAGFWKTKLPQVVKQLIWRDRVQLGQASGAAVPGHRDHVHLALQRAFAFDAGAMGKLIQGASSGKLGDLGSLLASIGGIGGEGKATGPAPQIAKLAAQGPEGGIRDLAQGALDKLVAAANQLLASRDTGAAGGAGGGQSFAGFKGPWVSVEHQIAAARRWSVPDWDWVIGHESGGRPDAKNPTSTAFGLGQLLDSTYAKYGGGPGSSATDQIKAMASYIADRYGTPTKAKAFWQAHNYYARGGFVDPGSVQAGIDAIEQSFDGGGTVQAAKQPPAKHPFAPPDKPKTPKQKAANKHAAKNRHDATVRKQQAAAKRTRQKTTTKRHHYDTRRVGEIAQEIDPSAKLPELFGVSGYDSLIAGLDDRSSQLVSLFGQMDVLFSPDDKGTPAHLGHRFLDTGADTIADLNLADLRTQQLDDLLTYEHAERDTIVGGGKGFDVGAVAKIKHLLSQLTRLTARFKAWLADLHKAYAALKALRAERGKKKPDKKALAKHESELRDHWRGMGLDAGEFSSAGRNLLQDSYFLSKLEPRLASKLTRFGSGANPFKDVQTTLADQLHSYIGTAGLGKTGDPFLDAAGIQGDGSSKLASVLFDINVNETERASLTEDGLRAQLAGKPASQGQGQGQGQGQNQSEIADLIRQQNVLLARGQQLQAATKDVIPGLRRELPFLGGFAMGIERVPQKSLAVLHRDEMIVPDAEGPYGNQLKGSKIGRDAPVEITLVMKDRAGALVELIDARTQAHIPLIIRKADRAIGAKGRQLANAPGRVG